MDFPFVLISIKRMSYFIPLSVFILFFLNFNFNLYHNPNHFALIYVDCQLFCYPKRLQTHSFIHITQRFIVNHSSENDYRMFTHCSRRMYYVRGFLVYMPLMIFGWTDWLHWNRIQKCANPELINNKCYAFSSISIYSLFIHLTTAFTVCPFIFIYVWAGVTHTACILNNYEL